MPLWLRVFVAVLIAQKAEFLSVFHSVQATNDPLQHVSDYVLGMTQIQRHGLPDQRKIKGYRREVQTR